MTDRELLEAAAKAGGVEIGEWYGYAYAFYSTSERAEWNPLTDDGDALRLVVRLNLHIEYEMMPEGPICCATYPDDQTEIGVFEWLEKDSYAATRRAIVRAAAAIGAAK